MKYAIISNTGEIETEAFKMIGLSTKRGNNSLIGRFGSGTKYSIAYLLKNNLKFKVFSGEREILFSVKDGVYRNTDYQMILIDNVETSMTTDMGPDWKFWFCLREFYCNAIDEGDHSIMFTQDTEDVNTLPYGTAGTTKIYIEMPDTFSMEVWDSLFSEDRSAIYVGVDEFNNPYSIYPRLNSKTAILYHKEIRCTTDTDILHTIYDYSSHGFDINESRVLNGTWSTRRQIGRILQTISNPAIVETILKNLNKNSIERDAIIENYFDLQLDSVWASVISSLNIVVEELAGRYVNEKDFDKYVQMPHKFCKKINEIMPEKRILGMMKSINADSDNTEVADEDVPKRLKFLVDTTFNELRDNLNYPIRYPVKFFSSPWENKNGNRELKLGYADMNNKIIYLNIELTQYGKKDIALTLIEENEHLNSKADDKSLGFQDYLFRMILSLLEEHNGYFF